jgi:hypothetical protein
MTGMKLEDANVGREAMSKDAKFVWIRVEREPEAEGSLNDPESSQGR